MIHLLFTGGTISMHRDSAAGGNVPAHGGEALVGYAPALSRVGPYRIEDWARLPACHLDQDRLWALRERVRSVAESGEVRGIVVDEDVDIYNMEDVLWAITTRVNPKEDLLSICEGGFGQTFQPAERSSAGDRQWTQSNIRFSGALGIDATRPFVYKEAFARARYNVELVDLARFYTPEQIRKAKAGQRDYAKFLAERGI